MRDWCCGFTGKATVYIKCQLLRADSAPCSGGQGKESNEAQISEPLPSKGETRMKLLTHGFQLDPALAVLAIWGVNQHLEDLFLSLSPSLSVSLCIALPFKLIHL